MNYSQKKHCIVCSLELSKDYPLPFHAAICSSVWIENEVKKEMSE